MKFSGRCFWTVAVQTPDIQVEVGQLGLDFKRRYLRWRVHCLDASELGSSGDQVLMETLCDDFTDRDELINYVATIAPWAERREPGPFVGGEYVASARLKDIEPTRYARTRNFLDGAVTRLSPYVRHGILSLDEIRNCALTKTEDPHQAEKFIQLAWRDYWQRVYHHYPERGPDVESYKTGFTVEDYAVNLPDDIANGETGVGCIDQFIAELVTTGYLHNHAHVRGRIRCPLAANQLASGARWFLHLVDGDPASNNLSWQWVASTFSHKPYIFNLDNVRKYAGNEINTRSEDNSALDLSYEALTKRLFPNLSQERHR